MRASVVMPEVGSQPARLSVWFADPGELVYEGDRLVEVVVNGATFDVSAPATGRLVEKCVSPGQPLTTGQLLGTIDVAES